MSFKDNINAKAEEYEVKAKAEKAAAAAAAAAKQAGDRLAGVVAANSDKIDVAIDKALDTVDKKTEGKYADKVIKAKEAAHRQVEKIAASSHGAEIWEESGDERPGASPDAGPATPADPSHFPPKDGLPPY